MTVVICVKNNSSLFVFSIIIILNIPDSTHSLRKKQIEYNMDGVNENTNDSKVI